MQSLDEANAGETSSNTQAKTQSNNDKRDYFAEMSLALRLMVTGGKPREEERFTRSDGMLLVDALMLAAKMARDKGQPQVVLTDVFQPSGKSSRIERR